MELDRLGQTAQAHTQTGALDAESSRCAQGSRAGIRCAGKLDWRWCGDGGPLEARRRRVKAVPLDFQVWPRKRSVCRRHGAEFGRLRQQLSQKEQALGAAEEKRLAAELEFQRAEQRLAEIGAKRTEAQTRAAILEWVRATQPRYAEILGRQRGINEELNRATTALAKDRESEAKAAGDLRTQESDTKQATEKLTRNARELTAVLA